MVDNTESVRNETFRQIKYCLYQSIHHGKYREEYASLARHELSSAHDTPPQTHHIYSTRARYSPTQQNSAAHSTLASVLAVQAPGTTLSLTAPARAFGDMVNRVKACPTGAMALPALRSTLRASGSILVDTNSQLREPGSCKAATKLCHSKHT